MELLRAPAALFGAAVGLRRALYDRGWLPSERVEVPVVSVGNLSAGGTGKTPMVAWVARALARRSLRVGLVSRGYGAREGESNDEARLLAELLPDVPHVLDSNRARGARQLVARQIDVVVLDDGFQHRALRRDLDLVLVDATRPWGLPGRRVHDAPLLPRGLLREPPSALGRAHAIVLTRVDQVPASELVELRREVESVAPGVALAAARHRASALRSLDGAREPLEALRGRAVDAFSGIGNPEAFERSLAGLGAQVAEHRCFPDHHPYAAGDLAGLGRGGRPVLTTAKDAVKLRAVAGALAPALRVLEVELELVEGQAALEALLEALPEARAARERGALHEGLHG